MQICRIDLIDFRNYERLSLDLPAGVVVLHGPNGAGKTSLLEAVSLAASGDSPRARTTEEMVRTGSEHGFVRGHFVARGRSTRIEIGLARTGKRQLKVDGVVRQRDDLIGLAPVVLFWAEDTEMVRGEPSGRRRLMDRELSLVSKQYWHHLSRYRRALEQRNKLLKLIREGREREDALAPWDRALARHGATIIAERKAFLEALGPRVLAAHDVLTGAQKPLAISYRPSVALPEGPAFAESVADSLLAALEEQRRADIGAGMTTTGPHREDFQLLLDEQPIRVFGSQGEQRSCAVAIRMGLAAVVQAMTGEQPLVLLDDVLSELDERHRQGVFAVCADSDQVIITCCDSADIPAEVLASAASLEVRGGTVGVR